VEEISIGAGLTLTGTTLSAQAGSGTVTSVSGGSTGLTFTTPSTTPVMGGDLAVASGGTGQTSLPAHAVILGEGTGPVGAVTIGTAGRVLIDQGAGTDPAFAGFNSLTAGDAALTDAEVSAAGSVNQTVSLDRIAGFINPGLCDFRLSAQAGSSISTADQVSAGTIYLVPAQNQGYSVAGGGRLALYDGTRWRLYTSAQVSLALTVAASTNYDVFAYDNAGTITLELLAWSSDTVRAVALAVQDGVLVKSGAATRRYMGTVRGSGANVTEDSVLRRFVFSHHNRLRRPLRVAGDAGLTWNLATSGWRQANADTTKQLAMVLGTPDIAVEAGLLVLSSSATQGTAYVAVGLDSTTVPSNDSYGRYGMVLAQSVSLAAMTTSYYSGYPGLGYHRLVWLENCYNNSSVTFYGDFTGSATTNPVRSGMFGWVTG
jgi:hypothetical protein